MKSVLSWLTGSSSTCQVTYDDWSDEYTWDCMMRVDGRFSSQKVPDEVGHAISSRHNYHHDYHPTQTQDWCIGVKTDNADFESEMLGRIRTLVTDTICSHEVENEDDESNDWRVF